MFRLLLIAAIFSLAVCAPLDNDDKRILGTATPAQIGQFPYIVSLRRTGTNQVHLAGGALINHQWVLSAASVASLFVSTPTQLLVAYGVISVPAVVAPGFSNIAQEIQINEGLALIRVQSVVCNAARFGFISPIFMDMTALTAPGASDGLVAGWGLTSQGATTMLMFRRVENFVACPENADRSVCTNGVLCSTDVGSPLVSTTGVIGIATATTCGAIDTYARISFYRMWIHVVTGI